MDHHEHSEHDGDNVALTTTYIQWGHKVVDHHNHNDNKDNNVSDNNSIVLGAAYNVNSSTYVFSYRALGVYQRAV